MPTLIPSQSEKYGRYFAGSSLVDPITDSHGADADIAIFLEPEEGPTPTYRGTAFGETLSPGEADMLHWLISSRATHGENIQTHEIDSLLQGTSRLVPNSSVTHWTVVPVNN